MLPTPAIVPIVLVDLLQGTERFPALGTLPAVPIRPLCVCLLSQPSIHWHPLPLAVLDGQASSTNASTRCAIRFVLISMCIKY